MKLYSQILQVGVAFLLSIIALPSQALLVLEVSSGGSTETITDGDLLDFAAGTEGLISVPLLSVNGWTIFATGTSNSTTYIDEALLDLSSLAISGGSGEITISLTETNYMPTGSGQVDYLTTVGGTTDGNISLSYYLGGDLLHDSGLMSGFVFSDEGSGSAMISGPFSLTTIATISHNNAGDLTSFDAGFSLITVPVPEPASLALFGLGLAGFGFMRRTKKV